ncbi:MULTISPECIES: hypothetical protein [Methylomonas]|uniref:Uncharacterized protein n=1 Tax=Methylomonas koyamae TaxID=702114 RepID=A0A177NFG7_9GAMM|nr:hypothetical protein [Methylomonas koyamae]OAI16757.1 hypothetical protein A1355_09615 [Methylomonas koyamae]
MRRLFHQSLTVMKNAFRRLEEQVPPPRPVPWNDSFVFRHVEKTIQQALVQKAARLISTLHAVDVLLLNGHLQEQATLQRVLDEIAEDIFFLAAAITNDEITDRHRQYLEEFYAEEFPDPSNPMARHQKPNMVPRKKIRAYVNRVLSTDPNPSRLSDIGESVSSVYSGFVHASSPQIMDMCGGDPPRFQIEGMLGTPRVAEHVRDAWNYYYRGLTAITVIAKAFGDKPLVDSMYQYIVKFEEVSGVDYGGKKSAT